MPIDFQKLEHASGRALASSDSLDQMRAYGLDTVTFVQIIRRLGAYVVWDAERKGEDSVQVMAEAAVTVGLLTGLELGLDTERSGGINPRS